MAIWISLILDRSSCQTSDQVLGLPEQLRQSHLQSICDLKEITDRRIPKPALDACEIRAVYICHRRQLFLRPSLRIAQLANATAQGAEDFSFRWQPTSWG